MKNVFFVLLASLLCIVSADEIQNINHTIDRLKELQNSEIGYLANTILGECYIQDNCVFKDGEKLSKDVKKGLELLEKASDQYDIAAFNAGDYYLFGKEGIQKDYQKAYEYLKKASDKGHKQAMYLLALMYNDGLAKPEGSTPADLVAIQLFLEACEKGLKEACDSVSIKTEGKITTINTK